ncbi:MAG: DEAD/DEAH box helicase [Erysipelotrichales bacterium]|nr:DEAD/DEAH box helicase [Erysipelotrichales bacterium]
MQFNTYLSDPILLEKIYDHGYTTMTKIQQKAIPVILEGRDVIGQSQTGSGKTAAFALPILEGIDVYQKYTQALVLCPTRELCQQTCSEFAKFMEDPEQVVALYGGELITKQWERLEKGCAIIVATPGRLLDHLRKKRVYLQRLSYVVIDEADDMLAMGFAEEMNQLLTYLPSYRQTLLFSATMPRSILNLSKSYQNAPVHIHIEPEHSTASTVTEEVYLAAPHQKMELLLQILLLEDPKSCMVFANTKKQVDEILAFLIDHKKSVSALHGDMSQEARTLVMQRFKNKQFSILVASDIASRGIDIQELDLVINYDIPKELDNYVHRIGRTGRIYHSGKAITFAMPQKMHELEALEKHIKHQLYRMPLPKQKTLDEAVKAQLRNELNTVIEKKENTMFTSILEEYDAEELASALLQILFSDRKYTAIDLHTKREDEYKEKINFATIRISLGKRDGVAAAHLISAIAEASEISGKQIGKITVRDSESYVEVPLEKVNFILSRIHTITICGKAFGAKLVKNK